MNPNERSAGGRIHVIDGFLDWPLGLSGNNRLLDIMDTLKQCDKFDGFVTLAEGTGLTQILKQGKLLAVRIVRLVCFSSLALGRPFAR